MFQEHERTNVFGLSISIKHWLVTSYGPNATVGLAITAKRRRILNPKTNIWHYPERNNPEGHYAQRPICPKDTMAKVNYAQRTLCPKDTIPKDTMPKGHYQ